MSSIFVSDGIKRSFTVKIDVENSTEADLFREVAKSYMLKLDPKENLRIIFSDKELRYNTRTKLRKVGIINGSTIVAIFKLPDKHSTSPAATEDADAVEANIDEENKDEEEVSITVPSPVKIDEENRDEEEVSITVPSPVKGDEENKDKEEVSITVPSPIKEDEENKDEEEVSITVPSPIKGDEKNKDEEEVSITVPSPVKRDEENKGEEEVSITVPSPVKKDEENKDEEEVSITVPSPVKRDEENKDEEEVSITVPSRVKIYEENTDEEEVSITVPSLVKADEENTDEAEVSITLPSLVKRDEENKDDEEVSITVPSPVKRDEENKDDEEVSITVPSPVKRDEENKDDEEEVSITVPSPVKRDEGKKDEEEVSITVPSPVKIDEENKDAEDVLAAESMPVKAKKKNKKKKRKDAKFVNLLEISADSQIVATDKENKEADDIPVAGSDPVKAKKKRKRKRNKRKPGKAESVVEKEEKRPVLEDLPEILALTFEPDFLDDDKTQRRAVLPPCSHVMGSETMRWYCKHRIDVGHTKFDCPYLLCPPFPDCCPAVWEYRHVRHVACFTPTEMRKTEEAIANNVLGKDSNTLTCPGCFTWCSKADPRQTRLRCFLCTKATGEEYLFCGYCLRVWENARSGRCANPTCKSIEATLDILRNSPTMDWYESPALRLCPRCGILTEYVGGCLQMHCQLCGYYYCFLCLKGAKSKGELRCDPFISFCPSAPLQTSIPQWDGRNRD